MAVKVILRQDVPNLGSAGELKQVAPGYFRNYLLPRRLAIEATKGNLRAQQATSTVKTGQVTKAKQETDILAERLRQISVTIPVRLGRQGRIYGSVTNKDIADALGEQQGLEIDRHKIELEEPLKSIGMHTVPVKLEHGTEAEVQVELVPKSGATES